MTRWITELLNTHADVESRYAQLRLNEIILPGTENACSSEFFDDREENYMHIPHIIQKYIWTENDKKNLYFTQETGRSLTELLDMGIRYFGLKITYNARNDNTWWITNGYHHKLLEEALSEIKNYLNNNTGNKEFVILDFKIDSLHNLSQQTQNNISQFYEILVNSFKNGDQLAGNGTDFIYLPTIPSPTENDSILLENNTQWHENYGPHPTYNSTSNPLGIPNNQPQYIDQNIIKTYINLPTLDMVYGKAVIFVDKTLYENVSNSRNIIKPFPSFLFIENSTDVEEPGLIINENKKWVNELHNRTNKYPIKYQNKDLKYHDSMFKKLDLSLTMGERFKNKSLTTKISLVAIILKFLIIPMTIFLVILFFICFIDIKHGTFWHVTLNISPTSKRFYIFSFYFILFILSALFIIIIEILKKKITSLHIPTNKEAAEQINKQLNNILETDKWNKRNISIVSLNFPTQNEITIIKNLNCPNAAINENDLENEPALHVCNVIRQDGKPDELHIVIKNVRNNTEPAKYAGKLKYTISSSGTRVDNQHQFSYDNDTIILDNQTVTKTNNYGLNNEYVFDNNISLNNLPAGNLKFTFIIEDSCQGLHPEIPVSTENPYENGIAQMSETLILETGDERNSVAFEDFNNISPTIKNNSSNRLLKYFQNRQY
jgi:hypothetical protein